MTALEEKKEEVISSLSSSSSLPPSSSSSSPVPSCTPSPIQPPIPVDRQWITKLLRRYPNPQSLYQDKALVVAPMVDQSDLPFRLLCRRYGANLAFTPMIHARLLVNSQPYRKKFLGTWLPHHQDRPLIAQICGSDPETVLQAARYLEPHVDGIDINCGCPQGIAKRGNYGAFLLEQEETLVTLVRYLIQHLTIPLSVKVRLLPTEDPQDSLPASLALYTKLVQEGIHLLTIHGRNRHQKGLLTGRADWSAIAHVVQMLGPTIPIFANGSIETPDDIHECFRVTGADGIMSSESVLEYPPLFYHQPQSPIPLRTIGRLQLAQEYLHLAVQYPPQKGGQGSGLKCIRIHIHRFLHADLQVDTELRQAVISMETLEGLQQAVNTLRERHIQSGHVVASESLSWYHRHRQDPVAVQERLERNSAVKRHELQDDAAECFCTLFGDDNDDDEEGECDGNQEANKAVDEDEFDDDDDEDENEDDYYENEYELT